MKPQKNSRQERYFSQYGQDRFIDEHIFHGKTKGLFVEIGAGDGLNLSNTAFFERSRGWKGFCIEPRKKAYKKLQKNRSGVCLNECLSVEPGIKKFLEIEGSGEMLSGVYENYSSEHLTRINEDRDGPNKKKLLRQIKCTPINDFLSKYSLFNIDYCSIDIEGGEIDLVKSIDFTKYRIFCLSIENNYKDRRIRSELEKMGYRLRARLGVDEIYTYGQKTYVERLLTPMIKKVGRIYRKIKGDSNDQMFLAQKKLIHNKSDIIIFDVGANRGQTTEKYKLIFPMSTIYGFEPTQEVFACYRNNFAGDLDVKPINLALSDKNRVEEFYINKCDYTNSFFPAVRLTKRLSHDNDDQLINFKTIKTRTETVDNFCSKEGIKKIDILKIDIQGGELKVLKGASEMLDKQQIRLIYLEVEFVLLYEGQPLFSEISEYLLKKGYRIFDLGNLERSSSGQLVSGDALFISNKLNNKHD